MVGSLGVGGRTFGLKKAQLLSSTPVTFGLVQGAPSLVCASVQWVVFPALRLVASLFFHIFGGLAPSSGGNCYYLNYLPEGGD